MADYGPAQVALIGFGGTVVTAAAGIIAARMSDRHERPDWFDRVARDLDELRRRVGALERDLDRPPRRRRRPVRRSPP